MTAHPDYPQDRGTPQGDRCTCGGIRYWHAVAPYGCDDCSCEAFTPEAADDGWDAAQAWIDDEDGCVADPEKDCGPTQTEERKQIGTITVTMTGVCDIPVYDTDWGWDWEQEDPNDSDMQAIEAIRRGESRYSTDYEFVRGES